MTPSGTQDRQATSRTTASDDQRYSLWLLEELQPVIDQHYHWYQQHEPWHDLTPVRSDTERVFVSADAEHVLIQGTDQATLVFVLEANPDRRSDVRNSTSGWEVFLF